MSTISRSEELKKRIKLLETQQALDLAALKAQFKSTYDSLQPINLIKSTIHDVVKEPQVRSDLTSAAVSLLAGYAAKKVAFGNTDSVVKKLLGDLFQLGVTTTVARHPDEIKNVLKKLVGIAWWVQKTAVEVSDGKGVRKRLMNEIMRLTQLIQTAHPQLYIILEETPLPETGPDNVVSTASLRDYRDSLKRQLEQFGAKPTAA
jgi:hypothetical protein